MECEFRRQPWLAAPVLRHQERSNIEGVTFYFVDNQYYFGRSYIYGLGGDEYERFAFF